MDLTGKATQVADYLNRPVTYFAGGLAIGHSHSLFVDLALLGVLGAVVLLNTSKHEFWGTLKD